MKVILILLINFIAYSEEYLLSVNQNVVVESAEFLILCGKQITRREAQIINDTTSTKFITLASGNCEKISYQLNGYSKNKTDKKLISINQVDTRYIKWSNLDYTEITEKNLQTQKELESVTNNIDNIKHKVNAIKNDAIMIVQVKELVERKLKLKDLLRELEFLNAQKQMLENQLSSLNIVQDAANFENREMMLNTVLESIRSDKNKLKLMQQAKEAELEKQEEAFLAGSTADDSAELEQELQNLNKDNFSNP